MLDLPFRLATSLFGHAGIEWDLTSCSPEELDRIRAWTALYRRLRPLLHSGAVVRADATDEGTVLHGVVAQDRREAVFCFARTATSPSAVPGRTPLPGLDPELSYRLELCPEVSALAAIADQPAWLAGDGFGSPISGRLLSGAGLTLPVLHPGQAVVLRLVAVGAALGGGRPGTRRGSRRRALSVRC